MRLQNSQCIVGALQYFNHAQPLRPSQHGTEEALYYQNVQIIGQVKVMFHLLNTAHKITAR